MASKKKNAIVKLSPISERITALAVQSGGEDDAAEWNMKDDPEAGGISWTDFDRVRTMSGGAPGFEVVDMLCDESEHHQELLFQPVYLKHGRALHLSEFGKGEGGTPDCASPDGRVGVGRIEEGGPVIQRDCKTCPMAQWGSSLKGGNGQACSQMMLLFGFVLDENGEAANEMPAVLKIPPTSVQSFRKFIFRLGIKKLPYWGVCLRLSTQKLTSAGNAAYSKIIFQVAHTLSAQDRAAVRPLAESMRSMMGAKSAADLQRDLSTPREEVVKPAAAKVVDDDAVGYPGEDEEVVTDEMFDEVPF